MTNEYVCCDCELFCELTQIDEGIGITEFWGAVSNHVDMVTVSECCEADYVDSLSAFDEIGDAHTQTDLFYDKSNNCVVIPL